MGKTARRSNKVTREVFCKTWNSSDLIDEVAEKLDMNRASAASKASVLRKMGVSLKRFKQGRPRSIDADSLNSILNNESPDRKEIMGEILKCILELERTVAC